jgi:putative DNA primase/helicase
MRYHGWQFREAAQAVDGVLGAARSDERRVRPMPQPAFLGPAKPPDYSSGRRDAAHLLMQAGDRAIVERYLSSRGLRTFPSCLRGHPRLRYRHDGVDHGYMPAMLAPVRGPDGNLRTVHRTWIDPNLPARKKLNGPIGSGAAVRLFESCAVLGIAEGIETAIAAHELHNIPVWSCISTSGIRNFEPPTGTRHLIIFADNDEAGEQAARHLIERLRDTLDIEARLPRLPGTDWLDVLHARRRRAS